MTGIMSWLSAMIRVSEAAVTSRQFASIMSAAFLAYRRVPEHLQIEDI